MNRYIAHSLTLIALAALQGASARERFYFVQAEPTIWNYLPANKDCVMGMELDTGDGVPAERSCPKFNMSSMSGGGMHGMAAAASARSLQSHKEAGHAADADADGGQQHGGTGGGMDGGMQHDASTMGRRFHKLVYREYTDASFTVRAPVAQQWEHLGLLGPLLRAEVGDSLLVLFRNAADRPLSMHPHGVHYSKAEEGASYAGSAASAAVAPGGTYLYRWEVPESAGPGPQDASSVLWTYHSHIDEVGDTNAGLIGPIVVTRRGWAREDASPVDIDQEVVLAYNVYDEGESALFALNAAQLLNASELDHAMSDAGFADSNRKYSLNGFLFGNLPNITLTLGARVRWYLFAMGSEESLHTAHWHGQTLLHEGRRVDTVDLLPATFRVTDMLADNAGAWMMHCHVNHHIHGGMMALYEVREEMAAMHMPMPEAEPWVWAATALTIAVPMLAIGALLRKSYQGSLSAGKAAFPAQQAPPAVRGEPAALPLASAALPAASSSTRASSAPAEPPMPQSQPQQQPLPLQSLADSDEAEEPMVQVVFH